MDSAFAATTMTFTRGLQVDNWWEIGVPDPDSSALVTGGPFIDLPMALLSSANEPAASIRTLVPR